jgi:hypothetical protein
VVPARNLPPVPNPADLVNQPARRAMGVACVVTQSPDDVDDYVRVQWAAEDDSGSEEIAVPWSARADRVPVIGDAGILFTDDRSDPFALIWATGTVPDA